MGRMVRTMKDTRVPYFDKWRKFIHLLRESKIGMRDRSTSERERVIFT